MHKRSIILVVILCVAAVYSAFMYVASLKRTTALQQALGKEEMRSTALQQENQNLVQSLEKEKATNVALTHKNDVLRQYLRAGTNKVRKLDHDFFEACGRIQQLTTETSLLKAENAALHTSKDELKFKLDQVTVENESMKAKLTSIPELKKTIRELKIQARNMARALRHTMGLDKSLEGNRGYLVKNGKPTVTPPPAKVKIEVTPMTERQ